MIYFTYRANETVTQGQFVQLSSDLETVENHTTGAVLGLCKSVYESEDNGLRYSEIYVAGGGGQQAVLNSQWDGSPSRFNVINAKVEPVASGGIGWILPDLPKQPKESGGLVFISIY